MSCIRKLAMNLYFPLLELFNQMLAHAPFFSTRKLLLTLIGWEIGKGVSIHRGIKITSFKNSVVIGKNTVINKNVLIDNRRKVIIGNNVSISQCVSLHTLGHDINHPLFITKGEEIQIDDYVVIFTGAKIMPGIHLSIGTVVYPYSIVTKTFDAYSVLAGNPAKCISMRDENQQYTLNYKVWFGL